MINLKYLLLITLISFSLQDENCLIHFKECIDAEFPITTTGSVENCLYHYADDPNKCAQCKNGYALSFYFTSCIQFENCLDMDETDTVCYDCFDGYANSNDGTKCIKFDNCYRMETGDKKCSDCAFYFHPDENGICQRTLCSEYNEENTCTKCYYGYYLDKNTNQCEKITIPYCLELDEENSTKCRRCLAVDYVNENGQCDFPSNLIEGCVEYNNEGQCKYCDGHTYDFSDDKLSCNLKPCKKTRDYCYVCKVGFYVDEKDGICVSYDGKIKDTSSNPNSNSDTTRIKVKYALLALILGILI